MVPQSEGSVESAHPEAVSGSPLLLVLLALSVLAVSCCLAKSTERQWVRKMSEDQYQL